MTPANSKSAEELPAVVAARLRENLGAHEFPSAQGWEGAPALQFDHDWRGENSDPERSTEVRLLWTPEILYIRFLCRYRTMTVFSDARADGWRYELWDRDVAEVFLQPDASDPLIYKEFEVAPNGMWIDLAVRHGEIEELSSGLHRRVTVDSAARTWTAELALPMKKVAPRFDPKQPWRANFFRIEGEGEPRFYAAWNPTHSPAPNFHVPAAFGVLSFGE